MNLFFAFPFSFQNCGASRNFLPIYEALIGSILFLVTQFFSLLPLPAMKLASPSFFSPPSNRSIPFLLSICLLILNPLLRASLPIQPPSGKKLFARFPPSFLRIASSLYPSLFLHVLCSLPFFEDFIASLAFWACRFSLLFRTSGAAAACLSPNCSPSLPFTEIRARHSFFAVFHRPTSFFPLAGRSARLGLTILPFSPKLSQTKSLFFYERFCGPSPPGGRREALSLSPPRRGRTLLFLHAPRKSFFFGLVRKEGPSSLLPRAAPVKTRALFPPFHPRGTWS